MLFAVSVTVNSTLTPSRFRLPGTTMPPMRKVRPCGASLAATCEGVKKNTRFFWKAASTSTAAIPSAATPTAIAVTRLCLGFTAFSTTVYQQGNLHPDQEKCNPVGTPHVEPIPAHGKKFSHWFSRIRQRTRANRSEEHTSELQSLAYLVCRLLLEKKKNNELKELNTHKEMQRNM